MKKPILVTTKHRGVFYGSMADDSKLPASVRLTGCRNIIYWSADVGGFLGLAADGPTAGCRVGAEADVTIYNVTSVSRVTPQAAKAFAAHPAYKQ